MKAFLVCLLFISVLLFPSYISARELLQNEMMSSDHNEDESHKPGACGPGTPYKRCIPKSKSKPAPKPCSKYRRNCGPPGSRK